MTVPTITRAELAGHADLPLVVLGPSIGTTATALWSAVAERLDGRAHVVGWDLPGHGHNREPVPEFTMAELARGVLDLVDRVLEERGEPGGRFHYAGDSVGGAVGVQLLLDAPERISRAAVLCSAARFGEPEQWRARAELVRRSGTAVMVAPSVGRWFAPGFVQGQPEAAARLLEALEDTDRHGYAAVCEALAGFDVRDRLADVGVPLLAVAGRHDQTTPVPELARLADGVTAGRLVVLDDVGHQAPVEAPAAVGRLLREHFALGSPTLEEVREEGMEVRRAVLGAAHVDRATARATDLTREFQELVTQYAWGSIWTRPGLDRRTRSIITLTALIARGHHEELAMHLRAARTNGLTDEEIKEVILQSAIYCGVPDANTAFRIAQRVLEQPEDDGR